jgi:exopolyphosphatase/guanosine-5'-triphosphate,3'-diphosphate pyrophosphatase
MTVVARWEWRRFGPGVTRARQGLRRFEPVRSEESDETYLIAVGSDASIKIRDGRMDVKELVTVGRHGLEQWRPILKAAFPLSASDVATVEAALRTPLGVSEDGRATLDRFVEDLRRSGSKARAVPVSKHRVHYEVGGCMAELTQLRTDAGKTMTIAVESPVPDDVITTARTLGLMDGPNTCVARGIKTALGFGGRRFAVVDVGTNSVKFHIGEREADGSWRTVVDRADVTRLGEGLDQTGRLGAAAMERTADAIDAMAKEAASAGVEALAAVGTAGLRIAPNAADMIGLVQQRCGVEIEVIAGEAEARLAYQAATSALARPDGVLTVFDTGGGSSQFTVGRGGEISERFSVDVGAVRFTERYGLDRPVGMSTLNLALAMIATALARLDDLPRPDAIIGMGGAITNLTAVKLGLKTYDRERVHGTVLDRVEIDRQIELYRARDAAGRREIAGLQPARAEVILAGACIVRVILTLLGRDSFVVSDRGLRHGVLMQRFGAQEPAGGPPRRVPVAG